MKNLQKIKIQLSKLNGNELVEISKWIYKRKRIVGRRECKAIIQKKIDDISALPVGTKVIIDNNNWQDLTGKVGEIVRHLGRGSNRSQVKLDETGLIWNIPRRYISVDISEDNLKEIENQKKAGAMLGRIFARVEF